MSLPQPAAGSNSPTNLPTSSKSSPPDKPTTCGSTTPRASRQPSTTESHDPWSAPRENAGPCLNDMRAASVL